TTTGHVISCNQGTCRREITPLPGQAYRPCPVLVNRGRGGWRARSRAARFAGDAHANQAPFAKPARDLNHLVKVDRRRQRSVDAIYARLHDRQHVDGEVHPLVDDLLEHDGDLHEPFTSHCVPPNDGTDTFINAFDSCDHAISRSSTYFSRTSLKYVFGHWLARRARTRCRFHVASLTATC